jgi:hypothetical protein
MADPQKSLSDLVSRVGVTLKAFSARLEKGDAVADELNECSSMLTALAEALTLYADKVPGTARAEHHIHREPPAP